MLFPPARRGSRPIARQKAAECFVCCNNWGERSIRELLVSFISVEFRPNAAAISPMVMARILTPLGFLIVPSLWSVRKEALRHWIRSDPVARANEKKLLGPSITPTGQAG